MEVLGELILFSARALVCSVSDGKSQRKIIRKDISNFCTVKANLSAASSSVEAISLRLPKSERFSHSLDCWQQWL